MLLALYARGAWPLGFVALVPWLLALDARRTGLGGALLGAWAMTLAFTAAVFGWFGAALGDYVGIGEAGGFAVLLLAAPLFQPQVLAFALARHAAARCGTGALPALAAVCAWVATEWAVPRLLGDTLGYGLHPSPLLRQAADVGGAAGLTLALLLVNEGVAGAVARRRDGARALAAPLALAVLVPLALTGYGRAALAAHAVSEGRTLRIGLVQSALVDYERLRREHGAHAVVREVLDLHFAMSLDAVTRQRADALLWSETVYPTTFGHPKSDAGAAFDREIVEFVDAAGVPLVFGTYDRDAQGEYNAAAFVEPRAGLLGLYRKTRVFPLTEHVPAALDSALLRRWLPWTGRWLPGSGARVFPLRLADGREIPVLPLICLDDTDASLASDGARLGAQAILTMSNDAWFAAHPPGAELHQAAAAFRSIETRLPQWRVTPSGHSALIDATGSVLAGTRVGERMLVVGELALREPPRTLRVAWGDWVGPAGGALLALLAGAAAWHAWRRSRPPGTPGPAEPVTRELRAAEVVVLPPAARALAGALRVLARGSLLVMGAAVLCGAAMQVGALAHLRAFAAFFLAPEVAAWCVLRAFAARAQLDGGTLVLERGQRRLELAVRAIVAALPWRVPLPGPGVGLRLASGERFDLACADPAALARGLAAAGAPPAPARAASRLAAYSQSHAGVRRGCLDRRWAKFGALPLVLALPAFHLHQRIAYGAALGEYLTFGLKAYLTTFALWWAEWAVGVVLCAAALRALVECGTLVVALLRPQRAVAARRVLERAALAVLYLGLPAWLLLRVLGG